MNPAFKIFNLFVVAHNLQQEEQFILKLNQKILMAHPITTNSLVTRPVIAMNSTMQVKVKMLSAKLIKLHGSCTSVVNHTTPTTSIHIYIYTYIRTVYSV